MSKLVSAKNSQGTLKLRSSLAAESDPSSAKIQIIHPKV